MKQNLWAWYLEWSTIARTAVKQWSLLIKLDFLRDRGLGEQPDEAEMTEGKTPALP